MGFGTRIRTTLESVGANVRQWRLLRAMTQAKLAEKTELDLKFIQNLEAGRRNPSVGTIVRVAAVLDIEPSVLLLLAKPAKRPTGRPPRRKRRSQ